MQHASPHADRDVGNDGDDADATLLHRPSNDADATMLAPPSGMGTAAAAAAGAAAPEPGDAPVALPAGFRLFEYRIDEVLGQGGFGITYLATDVHLNARVAIKEYLPAGMAQRASDRSVAPRWADDATLYQSGLDSFLVEARTLATFRHPNIVRVARFFEAHRTAYMVLEYERGVSLRQWWRKRRATPEDELLDLMRPLVDGLSQVHATGFLHRDIKPDNIVVRKDDGSLVLLDFGAARETVGPASAMGSVVTPGYAPPEQYDDGAQGPWTDIYALGATLYWMIAGVKPPPSPARAAGEAQLAPAVEAGRGRYGEAFLRAIDWALQLDPAARPQTLDAFAGMLFASHAGSVVLADALRAGERRTYRLGFGLGIKPLLALLRPASWPMAVKMTVAMMVAALAPMLITAYYNYDGSVKAVSASELRNLERIAQSTAGSIGQLVKDSESLANFISTDGDFIDYLQQPDQARRQGIEERLRKLVAANQDVDLIFLMNADGKALLSTDPAVLGFDFAFREYFQEAKAGRPFKTGILVGTKTRTRGTYFSYPVYDERRRVAGVVALRIRAATFADMLRQVSVGTGRTAFLIDGDGVLIEHPDPRWLHHSLARLSDSVQTRIATDQRFDTAFVDSLDMPDLARALVHARQPGSISYHSTLSDGDEHAGFAPVPHHDWVVGVTEPRSTFEAPLQRLFENVQASVLLVGLVFLILAVLFARTIVRPIARLTEAANALKEGDYERAAIRVTSNDEIGRLARTFNVMIDVLRQREREHDKQRGRARKRATD